MAKHIPNILTIIRFFLIPFIIIFALQSNYIVATIFLILSGITDIADGFIARKFNFITDFGKLMDPLADKCTQIATLLVLVIQGIIPAWILVIVIPSLGVIIYDFIKLGKTVYREINKKRKKES